MSLRCLFLLAWLFPLGEALAQQFSISGYVRDASSGEAIIGATVYVPQIQGGAQSNAYGFYSLTMSKGNYTLKFSAVGYQSREFPVELNKNQTLDVELRPDVKELREVVVKANSAEERLNSVEMSVNSLEMKAVKKIPALLGEVDLVRAIQLLPGVSTVGEGASGFNVRGGGVDQNLVLLDEAPVFNSSHLFGFFSVFNPDAVKDVKLFKGGIPSEYGGRASSILDVKLKEGNNKSWEANGGIGLIFSRFSLEGPIVPGKASFILAARRSYIDVLAKPFLKNTGSEDASFSFYDLTAKVNYQYNAKNNFYLSGYFGRDVFGSGFGINWGNSTLSARWNHVFSNRLFLNATAFRSIYNYNLDSDRRNRRPNNAFEWNSRIQTLSFKPDFSYFLNPLHTMKFGGQLIHYDFSPGAATATSNGVKRSFGQSERTGLETALYWSHDWILNPRFSLQYGLRWSRYQFSSSDGIYYDRIKTDISIENPSGYYLLTRFGKPNANIAAYANWEPRLGLKWSLPQQQSLKASYNRMAQYLHLMSNTAAATPLDVWTGSTNNIRPQLVDQWALGYFKNGGSEGRSWEFSLEAFYKTMQNQIDFADRSNLFLNPAFEKDLLFGKGRAYGLEAFLKGEWAAWSGWISYTLSRSERQMEALNQGHWYLSRFDRMHNLNTTLQYQWNERWSLGMNFAYITGVPYSLPVQKYAFDGIAYPHILPGTRANLRVPDYHRLDLSATRKNRKALFGKGSSEWVFSIYNAYNRRNPFSIYTRPNEGNTLQTEAVRLSIIGSIVPAVTYNFTF